MDSKIKVYSIQYGDEIPQKYLSIHNWSPIQAALFVSGIYIHSPKNGFPVDPFWPENDFSSLHMMVDFAEKWRLTQAEYILNQWLGQQGHAQQVSPRSFLNWYSENPVPYLDHLGKPIKPSIQSPKSLGAEAANPATTNLINSRNNVLRAVIEKAKNSALDPNDSQSVWAEFVKMAKNNPPPPLIGFEDEDGGQVKYEDGAEIKFLSKASFIKRLNRRRKLPANAR